MRLSAAYRGVNALLMKEGAEDFRSGQKFDDAIFFGENVDIHHIFPQDWCKGNGIKSAIYDSIINKTPLAYKTNRIMRGVAPSMYLAKLEKGSEASPPIAPANLDALLRSHLIDPILLRSDDFPGFMADRQRRLRALIEGAIGKSAYAGISADEGEDLEHESELDALSASAAPKTIL